MSIYIVRHGESIGNLDLKNYQKIADHAFALTELGVEQAELAANEVIKDLRQDTVTGRDRSILWNSSFARARHTADVMKQVFDSQTSTWHGISERIESPLIIEKQYGLYNSIAGHGEEQFEKQFPKYNEEYLRCREHNGRFFARPPGGESDFDVFVRGEIFWEKLQRVDPEFKQNHIIVCHGTTMRILEMIISRKTYEWFQRFKLPKNGAVIKSGWGILQADGSCKPFHD